MIERLSLRTPYDRTMMVKRSRLGWRAARRTGCRWSCTILVQHKEHSWRKWGKSPGGFDDRPYRSASGRQKMAEIRALCSDLKRMLHLRARTFAPLTFLAA